MSDTRTAASAMTPTARLARVRMASVGAVFMLIIQFILGILYNLYGTAPASGKPVGMFSNGWLVVHEIMAVLLVVAGIGLVIRAMGTSSGLAKATTWTGLVAIILAIGAGIGFIRDGASGSSLGMSLAFAIALACYFINVVRLPSE